MPGFFTADACVGIVRATAILPTATYDPGRVDPPIVRFGPAVNDYRRSGSLEDRYWEQAAAATRAWHESGPKPDPLQAAIDILGETLERPVTPATINGQPVFAGTVREINAGTLVHFDDVRHEFPGGLFDQTIIAQFAFNIYLSIPESGGITTVWRGRWKAADEVARRGYGFGPEVVRGYESVEVRPAPAEALVFEPSNYHAVSAAEDGRRIALAFFMGLTPSEDVVIWS